MLIVAFSFNNGLGRIYTSDELFSLVVVSGDTSERAHRASYVQTSSRHTHFWLNGQCHWCILIITQFELMEVLQIPSVFRYLGHFLIDPLSALTRVTDLHHIPLTILFSIPLLLAPPPPPNKTVSSSAQSRQYTGNPGVG